MDKAEMIKEVCNHYNVKTDDIYGLRKDQKTVNAKKAIYCVLRLCGFSFSNIGRIVNKDHGTIMATLKTIPVDVEEYAISVFKKYRRLDDEEMVYTQRTLRKQIINMLNNGSTLNQIIKETNQDKDTIINIVNFFIDNGWQKKIPNYNKGTYSTIFYEKDINKNNKL